MKSVIFTAQEHDIHFNLATEAYLMQSLPSDTRALFLWVNDPTVVIGRYQNPFIECNLPAMERDGVKLARRFSGGGAVYHDAGNLCFTFICPKDEYDKEDNFRIITSALDSLGIEADVSGRNDIVACGAKISGNAFQIKGGMACHHGTLLVDCDLSRLPSYLTPDRTKLEIHGVKSVVSRVRNISDIRPGITADDIKGSIIRAFTAASGGDCATEILNKETLLKDEYFRTTYGKLSSAEWNLGMTPRFKDLLRGRNKDGGFAFRLDVDHAVITAADVSGDALDTERDGRASEDSARPPLRPRRNQGPGKRKEPLRKRGPFAACGSDLRGSEQSEFEIMEAVRHGRVAVGREIHLSVVEGE